MAFPLMVGSEGQAFMAECKKAGKEVTVWTVNDEEEMKVAVGWGVKAVLTDRVAKFVELKNEVSDRYDKADISSLPTLQRQLWPVYPKSSSPGVLGSTTTLHT